MLLRPVSDLTLVCYGAMVEEVMAAADLLAEKGISAEVLKLNRVIPVDGGPVLDSVRKTGALLVAEEVTAPGSVGERLAALLSEEAVQVRRVKLLNLGRKYITHGSVSQLRRLCGIDRDSIAAAGEAIHKEGTSCP